MYGLLLENIADYITKNYGEEKWKIICQSCENDEKRFNVHQVYSECLLPNIAETAIKVLGVSEIQFFESLGLHFVSFVDSYEYNHVLSVLGRHMRDFLNGLDNLHEYLKFSYPKMIAPSFFCENETNIGLTLHYRSQRKGFVYYTMGQIKKVAKHFYDKEMQIEIASEEYSGESVHVIFRLFFDNQAFSVASQSLIRDEQHLPMTSTILLEIFPFSIIFSPDMIVYGIGNSLIDLVPFIIDQCITNWFILVRPSIPFTFHSILNRTNNIFEMVSSGLQCTHSGSNEGVSVQEDIELRLKGQMIYMSSWKMIMYIGTPVLTNLKSLFKTGLYINDLSMHDFSRDLMLAGTQQSAELNLALVQEQEKSRKLKESMIKLDLEMRRTDELLYQMIPMQVADRLRNGENSIDTCQMFQQVSILFSDVVTFTEICSRISPMEVVSMLNGMYSLFDALCERNKVYKVETIGDAYMVVSGAPVNEKNHALKVCDMALDMVDAITELKDPSTGHHLRIRVGVHSGSVVAGTVGLKMPRYCLFGDTVQVASCLESTSEAMKIQISDSTKELLPTEYDFIEWDNPKLKAKIQGGLKSYWLRCKEGRETNHIHVTSKANQPNGRESVFEKGRTYSPIILEQIESVFHQRETSLPEFSDTGSDVTQLNLGRSPREFNLSTSSLTDVFSVTDYIRKCEDIDESLTDDYPSLSPGIEADQGLPDIPLEDYGAYSIVNDDSCCTFLYKKERCTIYSHTCNIS